MVRRGQQDLKLSADADQYPCKERDVQSMNFIFNKVR